MTPRKRGTPAGETMPIRVFWARSKRSRIASRPWLWGRMNGSISGRFQSMASLGAHLWSLIHAPSPGRSIAMRFQSNRCCRSCRQPMASSTAALESQEASAQPPARRRPTSSRGTPRATGSSAAGPIVPGAEQIWGLDELPDGRLIGTADSLLFVYDPAADSVVTVAPGVPETIKKIEVSRDGWVYGLNEYRLFRFSPGPADRADSG